MRFDEIASRAGIHFVHEHGGSGRKYMVETMGSGACFLDHDGDGDPDLYLVQGAPLPGWTGEGTPRNALYRNDGAGTDGTVRFVDVTAAAGVGDPAWGMGCTAGDVDGDGDPDLLVTNLGADVLFRNDGDGRFSDVTAEAGVGDSRWSASAAFGDADGDGDLDLYVTHYVDFTVGTHRPCGSAIGGLSSYCHPNAYSPVPDSFYRNRGDGTFREESAAATPLEPGNGLGVVWSDLDLDGDLDLYVANDSSPNFLFLNRGGTFEEVALLRGAAVNEDGRSEAGMGVEAADLDGDELPDLFLTHLELESNTLYHNLGGGRFVDWSFPSGVGAASLRFVGFGTVALDYDQDGDLDLIVANGHILDDIAEVSSPDSSYAQPMHLLENDGKGRFREVGRLHGSVFSEPAVGRGLAAADVDLDGDLDVVATISHGPVRLLRASGAAGTWIALDLRDVGPNRQAVGARIAVGSGDRRQVREVRTASSYLSQNAMTVHFGLGSGGSASARIRWPDGARQSFAGLPVGHRYLVPRRAPAGSSDDGSVGAIPDA